MTTLAEWLTVARLILYLVVLYVMYKQIKICRWKGEPLSWMFWAVHGVIYSVVFLIDYQDKVFSPSLYNSWAAVVGIHGLIALISIEVIRYNRIRSVRHEC
jgi:hypothetical protein